MKRFSRILLGPVCLLLAVGCTTPEVNILRGVVFNNTPHPVTDVSITHLPTRQSASVSAILSGRTLQVGFGGARELLADSAVVQWSSRRGQNKVSLQIPKVQLGTDGAGVILVYEIKPGGRASAYFLSAEDRLPIR